MQTVPTLCASSTVFIASIGFTLGQPAPLESQPHKPLVVQHAGGHRRIPRPASSAHTTSITTSSRQPSPASVASIRLHAKHPPSTLASSSPSGPRPLSAAQASQPEERNEIIEARETAARPGESAPAKRRDRSSLTRRLSSIALSRKDATRPTSKRTSRLSLEHPADPLSTPNKLVKRSTSQRLPQFSPLEGSRRRSLILRRPATSHQRSITLSENYSHTSAGPEAVATHDRPFAGRPANKHFHSSPGTPVKQDMSTEANGLLFPVADTIHRICPIGPEPPMLMLASSLHSGQESKNETDITENYRFFLNPRLTYTIKPSSSVDFSSTTPLPVRAPRRSFSVREVLKRPTRRKEQALVTEHLDSPLIQSHARRVISDPAYSMVNGNNPPQAEPAGNSLRLDGSTPSPQTPIARNSNSPVEATARSSSTLKTPLNLGGSGLYSGSESDPRYSTAYRSSPLSQTSPADLTSPSSSASSSLNKRVLKPSRPSVTPSDVGSSALGSDNDPRIFSSGDEDEQGYQSDTVFDSLRTGRTHSSSGYQGSKLATLFDWDHTLDDTTDTGLELRRDARDSQENENNEARSPRDITTPIRSLAIGKADIPPTSPSPPVGPSRLHPNATNVQPLRMSPVKEGDAQSTDWSDNETESQQPFFTPSSDRRMEENSLSHWEILPEKPGTVNGTLLAPSFGANEEYAKDYEGDKKPNPFDWSEQQPQEKSSHTDTPPRPKTVHGKKDTESRSSRSTGRRAPSALHTRSQSVPATGAPAGANPNVAHKFGTWGIGSKGVTEDWDDDFAFDDFDYEDNKQSGNASNYEKPMFVPQTIREQQNNVLANIGLLKEWGLHIEELKELRAKAAALDIIKDSYNEETFAAVDAMIDLADQEAEDEGLAAYVSMTSSPGVELVSGKQNSTSPMSESKWGTPEPSSPSRKISDIDLGPPETPRPPASLDETVATPKNNRPRKDSEAIAKSVIQAIQQRRSAADPTTYPSTPSPQRKVPFDTATLRHIVPYVNGLMRRVKQLIRDAEGLQFSPPSRGDGEGLAISQAFVQPEPDPESPSAGRSRHSRFAKPWDYLLAPGTQSYDDHDFDEENGNT